MAPPVVTPMPFAPGKPAFRCLRGYSGDPSLTIQLDTAMIGELTFKVPWEALPPGPVGEYLEVIDSIRRVAASTSRSNLDDPSLLAQNGLRAE